MLTSTLSPDDEKQDEQLNKSQQHTDDLVNRLSSAEQKPGTINMGGFEDSLNSGTIADEDRNTVGNRETAAAKGAPSTPEFINNFTPESEGKKPSKWRARLKRAAPILSGGGLIGITGFILVGLASPSLLIVQMKEVMLEKFNTQLTSMDARTNKLLVSKLSGTTSGTCGKISIRCKFSTMSEKQVAKFKAAGIEVIPDENTTITGRVKPIALKFNGEEIKAINFSSTANSNSAFRSALKQVYNPKFAGFTGKAWSGVASRFKINKKTPELGAAEDKEKAKAKVNQIAKEGVEDTGSRLTVDGDDSCDSDDCMSKDKADTINEEARNLDGAAKDGSAAAEVRSKLSGISTGSITSAFKITSLADNACMVYGADATLNYAGKAIRSAQLVRYAMIYLSIADAIKGGASPDPADIEVLGNAATSVIKDSNDTTKTLVGSATDSFGYKYAQYGDTGASEQSMQIANRFLAGGGFVGTLAAATEAILEPIGGRKNAAALCGTLANPFVQGGSLLLGVASLFVPGANVVRITAGAIGGVAVSTVLSILPSMLADIVAGTVTNDLVGEEVGNAITSGSGALMSDALAGQNGNGLMTKEDAVAYNSLQTTTTDQYIADELLETSPFDATNPHTFIGSIVSSLLPLQSSSNPLTIATGLFATSLSSIFPISNAESQANYEESLTICQDQDVVDAGYAADPFCNPIRGIPVKYLGKDPGAVIDSLVANGDLNADDESATSQYSDFISKCITNDGPIGYSNLNAGFNVDEVSACMITNDTIADRYIFYMDSLINTAMDDNDE